jgi:DNA-binding NtrC family response regulator
MRVMVVDDDPLVLTTLADQVAFLGHEVIGLGDGIQALNLLAQQPYDLLLTDISMPHNGLVLVGAVGRAYPSLPVLVITGEGTPLIRAALACSGAYVIATLDKPVSPDTLEMIVDAIALQLEPAN